MVDSSRKKSDRSFGFQLSGFFIQRHQKIPDQNWILSEVGEFRGR